jgi:hypothetical protein
MRSRIALFLSVLGGTATTLAAAQEQKPAWQEPGFVMEEIVVWLPRDEQATRVERDVVAEIVVMLSLEEQAKIRGTGTSSDAIELAVRAADAATRL